MSEESGSTDKKASADSAPAKKEAVPGGTKKFISKQLMRKKMLEEQTNFPYDLMEAVDWIRANRISLQDPLSKRALLVNVMSDDEITSYLLKPLGRKLSGIDQAGLSERRGGAVAIVKEKSSRRGYWFGSHRQDVEKKVLGKGQSGKKELPYYQLRGEKVSSEPPQSKNLGEELAWVKANLQTIYDPFRKQTIGMARSSEDYLRYLLKAPQVRKSLGLPALDAGTFSKSTKYG